MSNRIDNLYSYNGGIYERRSRVDAQAGFVLATAASALLYKLLPSFSNPFLKQMKNEHSKNYLYRDVFMDAINMSGLKDKGLKIRHMDLSQAESVLPPKEVVNYDVKSGLNAFFSPFTKEIYLNLNKSTITGFHELGHAMNNMSSFAGKCLQKLRVPGYWVAGSMGTIALFSRRKPKDAPKDAFDKIQDNCALIAVAGMVPTVAEEAMASANGIKIAKQAGLKQDLIKNLKKFYGKALLSYVGYAAVTGLSVFAVSKITEAFTRPKKIY